MYLITRFVFLFSIACTTMSAASTVLLMLSGHAGDASNALALTLVWVFISMFMHWKTSDCFIPEHKYMHRV